MEVGPGVRPQVSRLTRVLDVLNEYGGSSSDDFGFEKWFERRCSDSDVDRLRNVCTASDFTNGHMFLDELSEVKKLLGTAVEDITVVYGHIQSLYEAALQSARADIFSVPPEILSMIFKEIKDDRKSVKNVMLTCRRFRDVAIQVPALWCTIRSTDTLTHSKRCLQRSLQHDLIIQIIKPLVKKKLVYAWLQKDFCELVSKVCERWKELHIELGASGDSRFSSHGYFKNLSLPRLTTLSIEYCAYLGQPILVDSMIRSWTTPKLKHFRGLPIDSISKFASSLTTCEFIIESLALVPTFTVMRKIVEQVSCCRNLRLDFFNNNGPNQGDMSLPLTESTFPELQTLWLASHQASHTGIGLTVRHLLTNIIPTSQITELTLEIYDEYYYRYRSTQYMLEFIDIAAAWEFGQVRVLNLILGRMDDYKYPLILNRMPGLEHITICSFDGKEPTDRFSDIRSNDVLPLGLKTVTFRDCPNISHDYLVDLAQTLNPAGFSEMFERLDVIDCPLSTGTRIGITLQLQEKFKQAYSVPKKQQDTSLYLKRIDYSSRRD